MIAWWWIPLSWFIVLGVVSTLIIIVAVLRQLRTAIQLRRIKKLAEQPPVVNNLTVVHGPSQDPREQ